MTKVDDLGAGATFEHARQVAGLSKVELWANCIAMGANFGEDELSAFLREDRKPTREEHNLIAQALNEQFIDKGMNHPVPYRD